MAPKHAKARLAYVQQTNEMAAAGWHGGASSGPRTKEGLAKIAAANTTTGQHTKEMILRRKEEAKIAKGLRDRLRVIEQNLRRHGVID